ncbi:MAG: DUF2290 domain-containing protein [Lentisphaeria bacterium]|nr:DUF2290 domain-containing protein [Lentisphaeria bacterium]
MSRKTSIENIDSFIKNILTELMNKSLCIDQNLPSKRNIESEIIIDSGKHENDDFRTSYLMKNNVKYEDIYNYCLKHRHFICQMFDGSLIQIMYVIKNKNIAKHSLSYFPNPDALNFITENKDIINDDYCEDINVNNIVRFPLRFDYNTTVTNSEPYSHLTLGSYKNCRIPVSSPLLPRHFFDFIFKFFYNVAYCKSGINITKNEICLPYTLTEDQKQDFHIFIPK